jgi:hypothetical protein
LACLRLRLDDLAESLDLMAMDDAWWYWMMDIEYNCW